MHLSSCNNLWLNFQIGRLAGGCFPTRASSHCSEFSRERREDIYPLSWNVTFTDLLLPAPANFRKSRIMHLRRVQSSLRQQEVALFAETVSYLPYQVRLNRPPKVPFRAYGIPPQSQSILRRTGQQYKPSQCGEHRFFNRF